MMFRALGWLCLLIAPNMVAARSVPECTYDRSLTTVDQLIKASHGAYLVTVSGFAPSTGRDFGNYQMSVISTIYGDEKQILDVRGFKPPLIPEQYYYDTTEHHSAFSHENLNENFGRGIIFEKLDGKCHTLPDFILGYTYLIFLNVDHELAFEPINSPVQDQWYLHVKARAEALRQVGR